MAVKITETLHYIRDGVAQSIDVTFEDLGEAMSSHFRALFVWGAGDHDEPFDWEAFDSEAQTYFDSHVGDFGAHDSYFNNFSAVWLTQLATEQWAQASKTWERSLQPVARWETTNGGRIHKGSPYYWAGGTALCSGDLDKAFLLIHAALEEDRQTTGLDNPISPASRFVCLDNTNMNQYWGPIVAEAAMFLESRLERYRNEVGGVLTIDLFREKFLRRVDLRHSVFFFVFAIFRAQRALRHSPRVLDDVFAPLVYATIPLSIYTVIETCLKQKYPAEKTIAPALTRFSVGHQLELHRADPYEQKTRFQVVKEDFSLDPDAVLIAFLDKNYAKTNLSALEAPLAIAAPLRNYVAHRIEPRPLIVDRFDDVLQLVLNGLFVVIEADF